jgi:signal transduction histidine kinase/DNA-binding response OmpR family regulator
MSSRPKILIVDDKPENLFALEKTLQKMDVQVFKAASGNDALALTLDHDFCVAIVDVQMPEMDGYELVELLRGSEATNSLPIIFVSAIFSDEYHHRKGYDAGAVDFLSKPFIPEILLSKVRVFMDLFEQRRQLQTTVEQLNHSNAILARRAMQLEISSKIGQQITSILEVETLLSQVVRVIEGGFGYSQVTVWLADEMALGSVVKSGAKKSPLVDVDEMKPDGIVHQVLTRGKTYHTNDAPNDPLAPLSSSNLRMLGSRLVLPLKAQNQILGALDIQSERRNAFANDDTTVLQIIADQVAVALRNAGLYSQVVRFNEQLEGTVAERTEELRQAYDTLEKLDKTKSDFISVAAHELRTPLTLIQGYANMLVSMVGTVSGAEEMVKGIIKGEERLLEVVNSMLDVSRLDTNTIKAYKELSSIGAIVRNVQGDFAKAWAERNLKFSMQGLDTLPLANADPDLLRKLFYQLIGNAIKYTPDGGSITISGRLLPPGEITDFREAAVHITIADTGIGIDPAHHELIFEKFYQTGKVDLHSSSKTGFKGGGPGLGLSIARGIINVHNGRIWVESPGYDEKTLPGSIFHILLPIK